MRLGAARPSGAVAGEGGVGARALQPLTMVLMGFLLIKVGFCKSIAWSADAFLVTRVVLYIRLYVTVSFVIYRNSKCILIVYTVFSLKGLPTVKLHLCFSFHEVRQEPVGSIPAADQWPVPAGGAAPTRGVRL